HLLADDRREPRVERHEERLDLTALRVRVATEVEDARVQEVEDRIDAAVVQEAEGAHLVTHRARRRRLRARRHAEHADLLIEVPEMRDLELLRLALERREAVGADRHLVAEHTLERAAVDLGIEEDVLSRRLR